MKYIKRAALLKMIMDRAEPVVRDATLEGRWWKPAPTEAPPAVRSLVLCREVELPPAKGEDGEVVVRRAVAASTPDPDRYDDVIDQASIRYANWKAALAPLLYGHDAGWGASGGCVIGRAAPDSIAIVEIPRPDLPGAIRDKKLALIFIPEWDDHPTNPLGQRVAHQWGTFIRTVSIGFRPGSCAMRRMLPKEHWAYSEQSSGIFYKDCEIYETSVVPVPANPYAMEMEEDGLPPRAAPDAPRAAHASEPGPHPGPHPEPHPEPPTDQQRGWWGA